MPNNFNQYFDARVVAKSEVWKERLLCNETGLRFPLQSPSLPWCYAPLFGESLLQRGIELREGFEAAAVEILARDDEQRLPIALLEAADFRA